MKTAGLDYRHIRRNPNDRARVCFSDPQRAAEILRERIPILKARVLQLESLLNQEPNQEKCEDYCKELAVTKLTIADSSRILGTKEVA